MIQNEIELEVTRERINHFWKIVDSIRKTEKNLENYQDSVGGFLAEIDKMNREVREYLSIHPSEFEREQQKIAA
ncbi:MAG: hypothetical protein H7Z37_16130 [Pyrinomonadaceae bacterium]|nr:hypothetical protein [Pyrinomonadaceae bacterium]